MKIFYNLVTRNALVLIDEQAHVLDGPFNSREEVERGAAELIDRLDRDLSAAGYRSLSPAA